ncbi:AMP-binding enzyme [Gracilaria domingensis]|nr:AMP-binding enzyme [Gracilaria domingensis]
MQSASRRAVASLRLVRARAAPRSAVRALATASSPSTIGQLLYAASAANPLKDAVKFMGYGDAHATVWTYSQLLSHVSALSTGLSHLNYSPNDAIMTLLPPDSPEYSVLLLAASQIGASVIPLPVPANPQDVDIDELKAALNEHRPTALFIHSGYSVAEDADASRIFAASNPIVNALDPSISLNDAAGLLGFVPLTGRPFQSAQFPFLRHIVSTGDVNARGIITFRSLLVYSGESPAVATDAALLVTPAGKASQSELIGGAEQLCSSLKISSDHTAKEGKIVTNPDLTIKSATSLVATIMKHALWVTTAERDVKEVAATENALIV